MIGAAIGILMLIIVAYLVVGSTLSTADQIINTQKEVTQQNEARMRTAINISDIEYQTGSTNIYLNITNTGNEPISDFEHMDVFLTIPGSNPAKYSYDETTGTEAAKTWTYSKITLTDGLTNEVIHPDMLDPGEMMWVHIDSFLVNPPVSGSFTSVSTPNGVTSSYTVSIR
ncbi:MAG: Archaebacterial flagellin [Methanoregula sp. PtaU1.Bin051]|nr:MAG: Archaebacterial flagellin [Methanoregula sp. PtaU1.Bin051]